MQPIEIDYNVILYMVMGLFALVGFFRGWLKEGLTTVALALLTVMLRYPDVAKAIFKYINNLIKLIWAFVEAGGSLEKVRQMAEVSPPFQLDPENTQVYIGFLLLLVIASYILGKVSFKEEMTALSRLAGGVLGLFNGFMAISLAREYIMGFFLRPETITAQAIPERFSIEVKGMPTQSILQGYFPIVVIAIGVIVLLLIIGSIFRIQMPIVKKK